MTAINWLMTTAMVTLIFAAFWPIRWLIAAVVVICLGASIYQLIGR